MLVKKKGNSWQVRPGLSSRPKISSEIFQNSHSKPVEHRAQSSRYFQPHGYRFIHLFYTFLNSSHLKRDQIANGNSITIQFFDKYLKNSFVLCRFSYHIHVSI